MATTNLTPEQQAAAAAMPALLYERTPAYRDEVLANNQMLAQGGLDWEKGAVGLPVPSVIADVPTPVVETPIVSTPVEETPVAIEPRTGRALTPCDLGMCEGRVSMGNIGSGYDDSSIYTNGVSTLVTGPGQGGYSRLAELATAGFLAGRGMTPQQVEAQNRAQEVEQFTNIQRSPLWQEAYQDAFRRTRSPQAAAAEANWAAAQANPGRAGIYYRTQQPLDNSAVNDAIDTATARSQITGDFSAGQALATNPVASAPVVTGVTPNGDGSFSITGSAGGQDFNTQAQNLNSFLYGASVDTPAQLWQLQQYQQQQALAQQKAAQEASQQNFNNEVNLFNATVKANPTARPMTEYQQAQVDNQQRRLDLYEQNNELRAANQAARSGTRQTTANGTPAPNAPTVVNGVSIAAPSTFTPPVNNQPTATNTAPSTRQSAPATQRTAATGIPQASVNAPVPTSTRRSVDEVNGLITSTNLRIQELARRPQGSLTASDRRNLQTLVDNMVWLRKEAELAGKPATANRNVIDITRPAGAQANIGERLQQAQWINNLTRQ